MTAPWTIDGKVSIVTGSNTGLGRATALELARRGSHVFLASRSAERTNPVVEIIRREVGHHRVDFLPLDLASHQSVRAAADTFLARGLPLHILVNNAGEGGQTGYTQNGFQMTFGVNYLGHYLFTRLLLERMQASTPARIVHVSSDMHYRASGIDWGKVTRPGRLPGIGEYVVSKLANVLLNRELAERLNATGVTTYAAHPGAVATDIYRRIPRPIRALITASMLTPAQGVRTQLRCAIDPALAGQTGLYYAEERAKEPSPLARDTDLVTELWHRSEGWVGDYL
jgi:NAD(P)-dependent dehydrogenase (short-subunit alcohol dehydrogenase family)